MTCSTQSVIDFVICVVVSQDPNLEKNLVDVAKGMGFLFEKWKDKSPEERVKQIFEVLSHKRFILLLDDIWKLVDLTQVGVPAADRDNGSKLLFTTRLEEVCNQLGAEEKVEVLRLTEKRASRDCPVS
ncbi:probable disease resistance protein At1g52660 [Jatropha curcas]|uniref:probable disease resistance protein At1g52660 n=1 Tax=Jatropha curcas TaxID=180498 RepID=UPI0005FBFA7F|nr:probable disease resistance protein At1g52660 [Jatropha curcas]